jgi:HEPN domain-containing protein
MIARDELTRIAQARLDDAECLLLGGRYDGAAYLCGYAVELCLKARICKALSWSEYPDDKRGFQSFKTHALDVLLQLTGAEEMVKHEMLSHWSIVARWDPEARYKPVGIVSQVDATDMLGAARELLERL